MPFNTGNPVIVQSDRTILLEVDNPSHVPARNALSTFAELEKSPEHIHTYRLSPLSLWNAASLGLSSETVLGELERYSKYDIPQNIRFEVVEQMARYGKLKLTSGGDRLRLESEDASIITEIWNNEQIRPWLDELLDNFTIALEPLNRGFVKQFLIKLGFPVEDIAGYTDGLPLDVGLKRRTDGGDDFCLRDYQTEAVDVFHAGGSDRGGSGVIVLPCGSGKTIIGIGVMAKCGMRTLILTTNITALRQWKDELLDKTTLSENDIGEYSGEHKDIRPVTIATYNILTYRKTRASAFPHFSLFNREDWGLIIYDEVHLLPAPVFRYTAEIQAKRRLGLTATLIREDGRETDVFSLIGPKKYDVPWQDLEKQGWIATATCTEIRVPLSHDLRVKYATAGLRKKYRTASENPAKMEVVERLIGRHEGDLILVIGQYINQLELIAREFNAPIITGKVDNLEREKLYGLFRKGAIKLLVVSKVANFAVDLPDANVAIQVSGTFGSRQEEAQRLGRILRPKLNGSMARFYSVVTKNTQDQEFAAKRQLFLTEQGYSYEIVDAGRYFDEWKQSVGGERTVTGV
ncbi:MAG: DEAD/DEAH box helicase [Candidatus Latescibacteria bacterium]|nr:DEAD/DEAH box helicase [Candidatus Latescibacterota bacterium]